MLIKPRTRTARLVIQELDDELLVYDLDTDRVHSLNATAAAVFRACDGETTVAELCDALARRLDARDASTLEPLVHTALSDLERAALLEPGDLPRFRRSRRDVLRAIGVSALLIPAVLSVTAPTAAQLLSCTPLGLPPILGRPCCPGLRPQGILGLCLP